MQNPEDKIEGYDAPQQPPSLPGGRLLIPAILVILVAVSGYCLIRLSSEERSRSELQRTNQALQSSLDQAKSQLQSAADQISAANARAQAAQIAPPQAQLAAGPGNSAGNAGESAAMGPPIHRTKTTSGSHRTTTRHAVNDPRWSAMDAKLAEQQKQIDSTRSDLAKTRQDLEGNIGSTRDELNGAIAKTHDEVVELRKRGERNYYEFDINKSSQFQRTGPISLSLKKANVKHRFYDIALIVDDQKIEKKHVNLYEPLWISVPDRPEPVQVVVNSISKDNIKGYLSESRFKKSELARAQDSATAQAASNPQGSQPAQPDSGANASSPLKPR